MVLPLELRTTQEGVIWPRRPLISARGLLSSVRNLPFSSHDKRPSRFRAVAFNAPGDILAAVDERGRVFAFFVAANRYALVQHLGVPALACCFNPARKTELLVTCENETAHCIDVQSQLLISTLRGHRFPARCVSFQKSGKLALTASQDAVILWDTKDWSRYRVLNAGPGVEQAAFVARGDLVAVCFQDDTIMMWELETLALRYRFSLPDHEDSAGLCTMAVSDDNKVLVASGRGPLLYVWELESQTIIRIIELPAPVKEVVSHAFLPGNDRTISILGDDGGLFFLKVSAKRPKIKVEIGDRGRTITAFDVECHARYLAACTSDGFLLLYDLEIARETASRSHALRKSKDLVDEDDNGVGFKIRSGLLRDVSARKTQPSVTESRPVPSKLIDSLFGGPYSRRSPVGGADGDRRENAYTSPSKAVDTSDSVSRSDNYPLTTVHPPIVKARLVSHAAKARSLLSNPVEVAKNRKRLVASLKCNGSYPRKYRVLVWRFLLRLPKNEDSFRSLLRKGKHSVFDRLKDDYPLHNERIFRRLHRVLSALAYWCPAFGEVSYLPAVVYPFVKIFRDNDLAAFEASMSVLLHWCGGFLFNLPYPPAAVLSALHEELERRDPQLYDHFIKHRVTAEVYGWSLLKTIFTEVLNEDEWMCLWDHLFTYSETPQLLVVAVLAYLSYFRVALLAATDRFSIEQFFHQQNAMDIQKFMQLLLNISERLDLSRFLVVDTIEAAMGEEAVQDPSESNTALWPLPVGQYPAFGRYPRLIVDLQISERNRIALEEGVLTQKLELLEQVKNESERLQNEHKKWLEEKRLVLSAEETRRKEGIAAEKARIMQLKSLDHETRKARLELLRGMEASARRTLEESSKMLQSEYHRLEAILAAQQERMDFEIESRKEDEELQRVELETEQRVMEIHKHQAMEEKLQRLRAEFLTRAKQQEMEDMLKFAAWKREDEEQKRQVKLELQEQERQALAEQERRVRQELENEFLERATAKEKEFIELEAQRHARRYQQQRHRQTSSSSVPARSESIPEERVKNKAKRQEWTATRSSDEEASRVVVTERSGRVGGERGSETADREINAASIEKYSQWNTPTGHNATPSARRRSSKQDTAQTSGTAHNRSVSTTRSAGRKLVFGDSPAAASPRQRSLNSSRSSNGHNSVASVAMQRTMEEMRLLEKALDNISSSMSSRSASFVEDDDRNARYTTADTESAARDRIASDPTSQVPISTTGEDAVRTHMEHHRMSPAPSPPMTPPPARTSPLLSPDHGSLADFSSRFDVQSVDAEAAADAHDHDVIDDSVETTAPLQRSIAELEEKLGIRFDELSDEEKEASDSDGDDEPIEDDRARLLARAKRLLEEESFDSDDDDEDLSDC